MEFFKELKSFDTFPYQPTLRFIFLGGFWNSEGTGFIFPILQKKKLRFSTQKLSDSHEQSMLEAKERYAAAFSLWGSNRLTTQLQKHRSLDPGPDLAAGDTEQSQLESPFSRNTSLMEKPNAKGNYKRARLMWKEQHAYEWGEKRQTLLCIGREESPLKGDDNWFGFWSMKRSLLGR